MEPIAEFLKNKDNNARLSNLDRWLVWDEDNSEWRVYFFPRYARQAKIVYGGTSLENALVVLGGISKNVP